ncbi:MAG: DUF4358 domain-containing protein, partial [Oscillospiraceae bacterium]|nr:DUF4358 domain-containing protein [Oscillospiraceae bacterium]
ISALALSAALLTACSGNDNNEETSAPSETPAVSDETDTSESETAAEDESEAADTDVVDDVLDDADDPGETDGGENADPNPLQPLADAALSVGEWPSLWEVTDPQILSDFFLLDETNENYRNMIVFQCPMSATMTEVIIIEAEDVESAKSDLEARRQKAIDQDAFYPNDVDLANASIVGTEGNYAYFILAGNAAEAETALVEAIKAL